MPVRPAPRPSAAVISTRVKPGLEAAYLQAGSRKVAAAQSKRASVFRATGFEPAVPGVQEDYVAILRFDCEANLQARGWTRPERQALVAEAGAAHRGVPHADGAERLRAMVSRCRDLPEGAPAPAAWKMNMIVLLTLYPTVFLWGLLFGTPFLAQTLKLDFPLALFIGNVVSVLITARLVPFAAKQFGWWLAPAGGQAGAPSISRAPVLLAAAYAVMILIFWKVL